MGVPQMLHIMVRHFESETYLGIAAFFRWSLPSQKAPFQITEDDVALLGEGLDLLKEISTVVRGKIA